MFCRGTKPLLPLQISRFFPGIYSVLLPAFSSVILLFSGILWTTENCFWSMAQLLRTIGAGNCKGARLYPWDHCKAYTDPLLEVCATGHRHPKVIDTIHRQNRCLPSHCHGEFVETPQSCNMLNCWPIICRATQPCLFHQLGAPKQQRPGTGQTVTNRTHILAFNNSYHGSTRCF